MVLKWKTINWKQWC